MQRVSSVSTMLTVSDLVKLTSAAKCTWLHEGNLEHQWLNCNNIRQRFMLVPEWYWTDYEIIWCPVWIWKWNVKLLIGFSYAGHILNTLVLVWLCLWCFSVEVFVILSHTCQSVVLFQIYLHSFVFSFVDLDAALLGQLPQLLIFEGIQISHSKY